MDALPPSTANRRGRPARADAPLPRVEAVDRALSLLDAFTDGTPRLTLSALAARTGLYPSTVLRLAGSLLAAGMLRRDGDGAFALGPALLRLGRLVQAGSGLAEALRPALARLVAATGETAAFYRAESGRRLCLFRLEPPRPLRHHLEEGTLLPLELGAAGHVLRAGLGAADPRAAQAAAEGWAASLGERDAEIAAVAVPLRAADGAFLGALGLTGPRGRIEAAIPALRDALLEEAARLRPALAG